MFGRLLGLIFGLAVAAFGLGLYKPDLAAKYVTQIDFHTIPLGPFGTYKTIISVLIMAFGLIVALAALQRSGKKAVRRAAPLLGTADAEPEAAPSIDRFPETPAAHGHDTHGHDDHGHDAHGRDDHGHDAHGHDAHGHDDHGHDAHGHDAHGHDDHGHDDPHDQHAHH